MNQAVFRFFAELNDFLPVDRKDVPYIYPFEGNPSVKHLIESLGIPHTEVQRVLANGKPTDLNYLVQDSDQIRVYPFSTGDSGETSVTQVRPEGEARFVLDNHLGKLAAYLRMLGFDALYRNDYQDEELAQIAADDQRVLLTRDRRLLMRSKVRYGYWVRSTDPRRQIEEVLQRFDLFAGIQPFQRCIRCNALLQSVRKEEIIQRLEPLTRLYYDEFRICPECRQVYWKGSHYGRMQQFIEQIRNSHDQGTV